WYSNGSDWLGAGGRHRELDRVERPCHIRDRALWSHRNVPERASGGGPIMSGSLGARRKEAVADAVRRARVVTAGRRSWSHRATGRWRGRAKIHIGDVALGPVGGGENGAVVRVHEPSLDGAACYSGRADEGVSRPRIRWR